MRAAAHLLPYEPMGCQSYAVELSQTAARQRDDLSGAEREKVDTALNALKEPGQPPGVVRIRSQNAPVQPLFYLRTPHFGIFHTVDEQRCVIYVLVVVPRADLTLPRR